MQQLWQHQSQLWLTSVSSSHSKRQTMYTIRYAVKASEPPSAAFLPMIYSALSHHPHLHPTSKSEKNLRNWLHKRSWPAEISQWTLKENQTRFSVVHDSMLDLHGEKIRLEEIFLVRQPDKPHDNQWKVAQYTVWLYSIF